jgi:hypothetical protein
VRHFSRGQSFPQGHKSDEELESFFGGLPKFLFDPGTAYHRHAEHKDQLGGPITVNPLMKKTLNLTKQAELLKHHRSDSRR